MNNIDKEYDRLVEHLHDCAKKAESFKTTKRRLSLETLELIRQRGAARAAGNQELTSPSLVFWQCVQHHRLHFSQRIRVRREVRVQIRTMLWKMGVQGIHGQWLLCLP
ncbi:hypothetical protein NECAME_14107 [Necator americanus]|uniref:Uncharacterized protein n=1 Tax=Necator americanus TaxID=51031 RepID=W2SQH9_NECAM|nr:hypothetical protein NECAME_14107 [Necator americanus]ETN71748.1 hypothetical protein NECAME_14107 [Necator americanus]